MGVESKYVRLTLSSGLCTEYKECFSLYDKQQRGKIKATDLMVVMRCLGASPTPGEVQRHLQTHGIGEWALAGGEYTIWAGGWALSRQLWSWGGAQQGVAQRVGCEQPSWWRGRWESELTSASCGDIWPGVQCIPQASWNPHSNQ